ncbi:hypothetical protein [Dictyobacter halimunensis]|uniref:hypothetical protein n=1 Tax=Dictyobacter halimunensis TaxID=3026934 RepID=UPI0030C6FC39
MLTLVEPGTFVPKNPAAHGEEQGHPPCGHHTPSVAPLLWSLENTRSALSSQPGGSGMPPDGSHIPTGFDFGPDDDGEENEPPYSCAFDQEQDGGHITYPPVDADLDVEDTHDADGSLMDEQLRCNTVRPRQQPTSDRLPLSWKEVE